MGDRALHKSLSYRFHGGGRFLGTPFDDVGEGSFAERSVKKFPEEFAQTSVRKELVSAEIEGGGLHARTVLHGGFDLFRESGGDAFAAVRAVAAAGAVFCDFEFDERQVKKLSHFEIIARIMVLAQVGAAVRAGRIPCKIMDGDMVRS